MRRLVVVLLAVASALSTHVQAAAAQARTTGGCPTIIVSCPDWGSGPTLTFSASVAGPDPNIKPTFNWTVTAGVITGGQGTPSITVDMAGLEGRSFTATVEVGGLPSACAGSASCTINVCGLRGAQKVSEYRDITFADEKGRLDDFAAELERDPQALGYILAYAGRRAYKGEAERRGRRAKSYLVERHGLSGERVVVIDGGFREERTVELFVVPTGATPPGATPTVDPEQVQIVTEKKGAKPAKPNPANP